MRKFLDIICMIIWTVCFVLDLVNVVRGEPVNGVTAALPALVCVMLYAERIYME